MEGSRGGSFASHWVDWRRLRGGNAQHRRAVDGWLQTHPALLYFGDSWFSTPLYPNLALQSSQAITGIGMLAGRPGATAAQMLAPAAVRNLVVRIELGGFDLLVLSLGGNDALGPRLEAAFKPWMASNPDRLDAHAAFEHLLSLGVFERTRLRYEALLDELARSRRLSSGFRVLAHGYAPLVRIGVPARLTVGNIGLIAILRNQTGPWLYGPMRKVLEDVDEALVFSRLLLEEGFRGQVLAPLTAAYPQLFSWVDFDGIEPLKGASAWYDEIHPDPDGFAAMVPRLNGAIRALLPEHKRHAVGPHPAGWD